MLRWVQAHWRGVTVAAIVVYVIALWTWALGGFSEQREICEITAAGKDCESYNILFATAWKIAKAADHWSALITALATGAIAYFTLTLRRSSDRMWKITQNILHHSERTAEHELRAYVLIQSGRIDFGEPTRPQWHLRVKNFGQTPAYAVQHWTHIWIEKHPLRIKLPEPPPEFRMSKSVLAPGNHEDMVWSKDPPIPEESMPLVGTPQGTIYIYGKIQYRDAFGKSHFTRYRLIHRAHSLGREDALWPDSDGNEAT